MNRPSPHRYSPLWHLTVARIREFLREPEAVFWTYVFPLALVAALGVAFRNQGIETFRIAVQSGNGAEAVCTSLNKNHRFKATAWDQQEARLRLRTGRADLMIVASVKPSQRYEYFFDPTRPQSVMARDSVNDFLQRAAGRREAAEVDDHQIEEPGGRYIDFLVPGLLGMGLMGGGLWGVGFAVVDMRIRKLLKRYLGTPMKRSHFMAAIIVSRLIFTISEVVLLLVFSRIVFGVSSQGSYAAIGLLILLGSLEFSGIGLLVASRAETIETVSGLLNAVMLPMWIGSGIFFSMERFPAAVQTGLNLLPLTPLIHALRSVILEGTSIVHLGADLAIIVTWGCLGFALALRLFRWK